MAVDTVNLRRLDLVLELTKAAQDSGTDPLVWAMQLSSSLSAEGVSMPSVDVAEILVSHICWSNNLPIAWKYLEKALTISVVPPLHVLALLSTRVIPRRRRHPVAYRLYMELLRRYAFSLPALINCPNHQKIMESISHELQFYQIFGIQSSEPGILLVEFVFSIVWELLDASLDDEALLDLTPEKNSRWQICSQDMEIDFVDSVEGKRKEVQVALNKINTIMAIEIIGEFFQKEVTSQILYLARQYMPMHWERFLMHVRLLAAKSSSLRNSKNLSPDALLQLASDTRNATHLGCKPKSQHKFHAVMARSSMSSSGHYHGTTCSALWLPIDLYLEDAMDGLHQVRTTNAAKSLAGLVKALQALNQTTWQDAFLGLWTAALRLVQRERNSSESPIPRIDTSLCILLSIATLAVVHIIEDEDIKAVDRAEQNSISQRKDIKFEGKHRQDLVSSLQRLDDFKGLLDPPPPVSSLADQAAAKATLFLSGITISSGLDGINFKEMPLNGSGNLRHLIVEACIARNILDTSAYLWPGYVKGQCSHIPHSPPEQVPGWASFMKGSPLTPSMVSVLVSTPATSSAEIERMYEIATNGTGDEKISAAMVFCGASLSRGWNIQEHTSLLIIRLLLPAVPTDFSGSHNHLIGCAPLLNILLVGISSTNFIQIFSLHGLVPQLAAALMPICEVFGSCAPNMSWTLSTGEKISSYAVFSNAFTLLLKLWRFDQPPLERVMGDVTPVGSHSTPEYLLLVRNSQLACCDNPPKYQSKTNRLRLPHASTRGPIFMDSFPKLTRWYRKHQECIASTLSGLVPGNPIYLIAEALLNMIFGKINRGQPVTPTNSGGSSSSASGVDDSSHHLTLPAWDILEAVPFVLDAALTACAHGKLSPRELTTGLKDLVMFLPASLATVVGYFSAEVTRGLWKPAVMNGTDWPSPVANLPSLEQQIKKILAVIGVDVPNLAIGGGSPLTLPLPLAALISLTITYKLDKGPGSLDLVCPSLSSLGVGCPWPCMPILCALWAQKVKRWGDYLAFSASQAVFHHNHDAVVQLIRVCFTTAVGLNSSSVTGNGGVGALVGHGFGSHFTGGFPYVAPGIFYLRVHRAVRNVVLIAEEIMSILMLTVKEIVNSRLPSDKVEKLRKTIYSTKYGQVSLADAMDRVRVAASLGASLVFLTGGIGSVQSLFLEVLPSWFISVHKLEPNGEKMGGVVEMLSGSALAYFTLFSVAFAWGVDSESKRRQSVVGKHLEFVASALDGKISVGCNKATWRAYVRGYFSLVVECTPCWMAEVNVDVVKRVSKGLKRWNEQELALALLQLSGADAMGAAAEMIIQTSF